MSFLPLTATFQKHFKLLYSEISTGICSLGIASMRLDLSLVCYNAAWLHIFTEQDPLMQIEVQFSIQI